MKNINITTKSESDYSEGVKNLKARGFQLIDQTFAWDLWETENTRYFILKEF